MPPRLWVLLLSAALCTASEDVPASDFAASAAAASSAHRYGEAIALRSRAADVASSASLSAAQAQDLTWAGRHTEAVEVLRRAQTVSRRARGAAETSGPSEIEAVLARAEAQAMVCLGPSAAVQALRVFNRARAAGPRPDDAWTALDLTKRVLALRTGGPPAAAADALRKQVAAITDSLLRSGPWSHPLQLPRHLHAGLAARPWHSVDPAQPGTFPALVPWVAALARSTAALGAEFLALHAGGLLEEERECIHAPEALPTRPAWAAGESDGSAAVDAVGGADTRAGLLRPASWRAFVPQGPWQPFHDAAGCNSRDAPVACALAGHLQSLLPSMKLHRLSYSALGPGAHLHPHWGQTNTQLKFHLGLLVPCAVQPDEAGTCSKPCARMRVGNETRAWTAGGVLFFDDSFEHEVWNECDATRVVLQAVFDHPEYVPAARDTAGGL